MFNRTENVNKTLNQAIADVLSEMKDHAPMSPEYSQLVDQLEKLYKLRSLKKGSGVSADSWVAAGTSLGGIVAILSFERAHVVTSKALNFVLKSR